MNQILENRRKWAAFLQEPDRKKTMGKLENIYEPGARCCLGHACHVLGSTYEPQNHYPSQDVVDALGLWTREGQASHSVLNNGQPSLSHWNDSFHKAVTPQEIGAYLETVIFGGDDTPFQPLNDVLYNCCTLNAEPDWSQFNWLELGGCVDEDGTTHGGMNRDEAEFFTIYGHLAEGGLEAITDVKDYDEANLILNHLAKVAQLPIEVNV